MATRFNRSSGIVLHISSLPSSYGIGTLGQCAYDFVDFLVKSGQKYWQILPIGHTGFGNSPYQCYSSIAGNPYFVDLDKLADIGLLSNEFLQEYDAEFSNPKKVNFDKVNSTRLGVLRTAFTNFSKISAEFNDSMNSFKEENAEWLNDYALFMALKDHFDQKPVWEWDYEIKKRKPDAVEYYSNLLKENIEFYIFVQYFFFKQFTDLKTYANSKGIQIIGDIPIYPSPDSSDIWVNPSLFKVDDNLLPSGIAGVPPDIYSETGQVWGNPVYDWNEMANQNYRWWISRIKYTLKVSDVIRIDHFRGFESYCEIPAGETTAVNGKWCPGPKMNLFNAISDALGEIPIIAEDLGIITDSVREFLAETGYPGMGVMIFGLWENEDNIHLPHNWKVNSVGYTSTHDSETFCQTVEDVLGDSDRKFALNYINLGSDDTIGLAAIRSAFSSPAVIAMTMMQDVLSLGKEGRMNTPSTVSNDNWAWRLTKSCFSEDLAEKLYHLSKTYKRLS